MTPRALLVAAVPHEGGVLLVFDPGDMQSLVDHGWTVDELSQVQAVIAAFKRTAERRLAAQEVKHGD
jgi:hypothetical protein